MGDEYIKRRDVLIKLEIAYGLARIDQKLPISDLQHEVNLIKAADVQPVKHGRWLSKIEGDIYEFSECSECGNMESCETPYCAQCGARIDLKKNKKNG